MPSFIAFIFTLFFMAGCESPKLVLNYPHEFDTQKSLEYWETLTLSPEDYPKNAALKNIRHTNIMHDYMQSNPGFISLQKFAIHNPKHTLITLRHWYYAYFYKNGYIIHYMSMEFQTASQAKAYITRLRTPQKVAEKIYRVGAFIFFYKISDMHDRLLNPEQAKEALAWVKAHYEKVTNRL